MDHFVPYNPLNKLSVHHTSVGSIFFELHQENWIFVKICKNFSCACHFERKNDVTPKILTPQSFDGQIICSVDCREQNDLSSFLMLPMVWGAGRHKWNFLVSRADFLDEFFQILAKLFVIDKKVQLKSFRSSKNNGSVFQVFFFFVGLLIFEKFAKNHFTASHFSEFTISEKPRVSLSNRFYCENGVSSTKI